MDKTDRKIDRRIQRTRALLRDALMALIVERGYHELTVQDITDKADIARTTFYLHYKDIDDLLFSSMAEIYEDLFKRYESFSLDDLLNGTASSNPADFEHIAQYANFYRIMLSEKGSMSFLLRVQAYLAAKFRQYFAASLPPGHQPRIPLDMLAHICAGSEIGLVSWWVKNNMPFSPADTARMGDQITCYGLKWGLGLDEKE